MSTKSDGQVVIEIVTDDEKAEEQLEKTADALERISDAAQSTANSLAEVSKDLETTKESADGLQEGLDHVGESADKSSKDVDGFKEELKKAEEAEAKLAAGAVILATALIAVGVEAVGAAMEFDSAFAKTQTIMDQNVMSAKQMRAEIMGLSKSSGMSAGNVSEAVYQAISGSVATEDATAFVEQANKLAVSGFTSLSNATDVLTTALNAYGLEADTVGGISNVLIQTQNLGKTSVDELASSMGKAISTGSAYGVNLENLSTAYVELTRGGIDTAEATTYISAMLNELGDAGSNVGGILQQQTGQSFGQLMAQGWSLGDVLQVLADTVDGDAEALMGLWSSQEAGKASNAIMTQSVADFNAVCAQMQQEMAGATGTTDKAYKTMTNTSEFIDQRFKNSINNLGIAFGDNLSPAVDGVKSLLTGLVEGITSVVQEYPLVSAVLTGATFGLGAMAIALTAYTIKAKLATAETWKLTKAMMSNPVLLLVTGITALAVGVGVYAAKTADATEETEKLSAASEAQKRELEELQKEYEAVCEAQGETSAEAQLLKEKIADQTEAFEKNKKTAQELENELQAAHDAYEEMTRRHEEQIEGIEDEYEGTLNLIERLNELTEAEYQSAAAKQEILSIVDILNQRIPELGLNYDALTGKMTMTPEEIVEAAENQYKQSEKQEKWNALQKRISAKYGDAENPSLEAAMNNAKAELDAINEQINEIINDYESQHWSNKIDRETLEIYDPEDGVVVYRNLETEVHNKLIDLGKERDNKETVYEKAKTEYENNEAEITRLSNELGYVEEENGMMTGEMAAMTSVTDNLTASMEALAIAYTEAYEAAYDSITGQYALWDTAADVVAMDADAVMAALQSQEEYWVNYNANINELIARQGEVEGLDEMIAAFGDGSEESVNMIAMMAGMTNEELNALVAQFQATSEAEKTAAGSLAEASVGMEQQMQNVIDEATEEVGKLNLSDEAKQSGIDTIMGYIDGATELLPEVQAAYQDVGAAVRAALLGTTSRQHINDDFWKVSAYASGTYYADSGLALVGEAGPELVYLRGGERILNAQETKAILNTVYPVAPDMAVVGAGAPAIASRSSVQLHATIAVPVQVDGREFARATAEYMGEEMEFEVM